MTTAATFAIILSLAVVGLLVLVFDILSAARTLTENTIAGVWRIATTSIPAYILFDNYAINLLEVDDANTTNPLQITEIASNVKYNFMYKCRSRICNSKSRYAFTISFPKTMGIVRKYSLNKVFAPGETIIGSLNPSMGILIATNGSETLQLIKDNELSLQYLASG